MSAGPPTSAAWALRFKWNMGWMHDTLGYIAQDPIHRKYHHQKLTFGLMYAFNENFILPISHDEVVHLEEGDARRMPGDLWQKLRQPAPLLRRSCDASGQEAAVHGQRFSADGGSGARRSASTGTSSTASRTHRGIKPGDRSERVLSRRTGARTSIDCEPAGFEWIDANDWEHSVISFIRKARTGRIACRRLRTSRRWCGAAIASASRS